MGKNIVICADGTWNKREKGDERNTNLAKFHDLLIEDDNQRLFYDPGIGTGMWKYIGGATGLGISENILDCYEYLVNNYEEDDNIFLFGFSRGAYTVRSLAGFIYRCGILRKAAKDRIEEAYDYYRKEDRKGQEDIKLTAAVNGNVYMIGVWDTVGALGVPVNWLNNFNPFLHKFHDTKLNASVKFAYQALAIDESRKNFSPTLWEGDPAAGQTIEQMWFAGSHSDVGGGYPERDLSDITLAWMINKAQQQGLELKSGYANTINPNANGFLHNAREGINMLYFKKLREIVEYKKSNIHGAVAKRMASNQNKPIPEYAPENLRNYEQLSDYYVVIPDEITTNNSRVA
jgi:uncharacterized protein (DUF2235 family)